MALLPVRNLGKLGITPDPDPHSLPLNGFSKGTNVIFDEGKVLRAPVFKTLYTDIRDNVTIDSLVGSADSQTGTVEQLLGSLSSSQRFLCSYSTPDKEVVVVCDTTGVVREYPDGSHAQVTPSGPMVSNSNPWTHCQSAGVSVLSRRGMVPAVRNLQTEFIYGPMRNNWDSTHTCAITRAFGDFLISLDVTKGTQNYPTMAKWCHPLQYSPNIDTGIDWDPTLTTNLAGENTFGQLTTPIRDGLTLNNMFVIYSKDQVWSMERTSSTEVFNYRRLFPTGGVVNVNCVTEVEGKHYVFGENDIYVHDGVTQKPLSDERVRKFIYSNLDRTKKSVCFTQHDSALNLIYFCYTTKEADAAYTATPYCNKAAVYNYRNDTWSFMDMPNVVGGTDVDISLAVAGYTPPSGEETPKVTLFLSTLTSGLTASRVYALDTPDEGVVLLTPHPETLKPSTLERTGISLDSEAQFELGSRKLLQGVRPMVSFASGSTDTLTFQLGGSEQIKSAVNYEATVSFDHVNDYKVDSRATGRYLAMKITVTTANLFRFSGYDLDVLKVAGR